MLSPPAIDSRTIKDERWVIKTFRPLLRALKVQHIPKSPDFTLVWLDEREWIIQGMGRCIVVIEQGDLPEEIGGMLITSHDTELDYFRLHILISNRLCDELSDDCRSLQKITAVHEFTHTVAALSAIARVRSKELIKRLKEIFQKKAHAIYFDDIKKVAAELSRSVSQKDDSQKKETEANHFPDEHFRLGFEDFPVSYPIIFEEFLLSKELYEEYFSKEVINEMWNALFKYDGQVFVNLVVPICSKIAQEKALYPEFVASRIVKILEDDPRMIKKV